MASERVEDQHIQYHFSDHDCPPLPRDSSAHNRLNLGKLRVKTIDGRSSKTRLQVGSKKIGLFRSSFSTRRKGRSFERLRRRSIFALTFPGLSASKVTGIDVLDGFEQELIAETGNGGLVIRDLLVKDYPIFVRLTE